MTTAQHTTITRPPSLFRRSDEASRSHHVRVPETGAPPRRDALPTRQGLRSGLPICGRDSANIAALEVRNGR